MWAVSPSASITPPPPSPRPHHNLLALFVIQGFHSSLDDVGTTSRAAWISGYSSPSPLAPINAHLISHNPLGAQLAAYCGIWEGFLLSKTPTVDRLGFWAMNESFWAMNGSSRPTPSKE